MSIGTLGLAALAGLLSILSPCVLPLVPIALGSAASEHRLGPIALAAGVMLSFVAIGLFVATIGFGLGLNADAFRFVAAALMVLIGGILVTPSLQIRLATAGGPIGNQAYRIFDGFSTSGIKGQFCVGLLLGAVWSPCVGPTLGAASVLAAQGKDLGSVSLTMMAFGLGAGIPLLLFGVMSRQLLLRWRNGLSKVSKSMKLAMGLLLIAFGLLVLTGLDKVVETKLVEVSPQWLTDITTRF